MHDSPCRFPDAALPLLQPGDIAVGSTIAGRNRIELEARLRLLCQYVRPAHRLDEQPDFQSSFGTGAQRHAWRHVHTKFAPTRRTRGGVAARSEV